MTKSTRSGPCSTCVNPAVCGEADGLGWPACSNLDPPSPVTIQIAEPLIVKPGDTLILCGPRMSDYEFDEFKHRLRLGIPEEVRVVYLENVDSMAIYRPHELATSESPD